MEAEQRMHGSVMRKQNLVSSNVPSIRLPLERQDFLNNERLSLLHHVPEFASLENGQETLASVWVGTVSCIVVSVDQDFLSPYPSCQPIILEIRRVGDKIQILNADIDLLDRSPDQAKNWWREAEREQLIIANHINPNNGVNHKGNGAPHWSDTIRRLNYTQLQHLLYFNANIARHAKKGKHHFDAWIQSGLGLLKDVVTPRGRIHLEKGLLSAQLYVDFDDNGFMTHFTRTEKLQELHPNVLKWFEQPLITVQHPPEFFDEAVQDSMATPIVAPPLQQKEHTTDVERVMDISNEVETLRVEGSSVGAEVEDSSVGTNPHVTAPSSKAVLSDHSKTPMGIRASFFKKG
jgi:hypothetical protein